MGLAILMFIPARKKKICAKVLLKLELDFNSAAEREYLGVKDYSLMFSI